MGSRGISCEKWQLKEWKLMRQWQLILDDQLGP